jgi:hypothetical protein
MVFGPYSFWQNSDGFTVAQNFSNLLDLLSFPIAKLHMQRSRVTVAVSVNDLSIVFRLSQRYSWGLHSSGGCGRVSGWLVPDVSRVKFSRFEYFRNVGHRSSIDLTRYTRRMKTWTTQYSVSAAFIPSRMKPDEIPPRRFLCAVSVEEQFLWMCSILKQMSFKYLTSTVQHLIIFDAKYTNPMSCVCAKHWTCCPAHNSGVFPNALHFCQLLFPFVTANKYPMRDFRLPPRCRWDLSSSGMLRSVEWYFCTELPLYTA